jgi:hypothetical protein
VTDKKMIQRDSTTEVGLDALREKLAAGSRAALSKSAEQRLDDSDLEARIASGVAAGLALAMSDEALMKRYWHQGWVELSTHGSNGASQWIGKRLFVAAVGIIVMWGLAILVRNGTIR